MQLEAWDGIEGRLTAANLWTEDLEGFVEEGSGMAVGLASVVHGGPPSGMRGQREMTRWLKESRRLLIEVDSKLSGAAGDPVVPVEEDDDPLRCPTCGARFDDEATCAAHIIGQHGD